ncbi:hypothetical protein BDZ89DRAFT_1036123 [Hymenopellis radicata]|nr:hypothetical protein BDZ89DRAFT_1036123 [Hymenopellis radicata]
MGLLQPAILDREDDNELIKDEERNLEEYKANQAKKKPFNEAGNRKNVQLRLARIFVYLSHIDIWMLSLDNVPLTSKTWEAILESLRVEGTSNTAITAIYSFNHKPSHVNVETPGDCPTKCYACERARGPLSDHGYMLSNTQKDSNADAMGLGFFDPNGHHEPDSNYDDVVISFSMELTTRSGAAWGLALLPPELVCGVVEHYQDLQNLVRWSLINRAWRVITQKELYNNLDFKSASDLEIIEDVIESFPHLACLVHHISFNLQPSQSASEGSIHLSTLAFARKVAPLLIKVHHLTIDIQPFGVDSVYIPLLIFDTIASASSHLRVAVWRGINQLSLCSAFHVLCTSRIQTIRIEASPYLMSASTDHIILDENIPSGLSLQHLYLIHTIKLLLPCIHKMLHSGSFSNLNEITCIARFDSDEDVNSWNTSIASIHVCRLTLIWDLQYVTEEVLVAQLDSMTVVPMITNASFVFLDFRSGMIQRTLRAREDTWPFLIRHLCILLPTWIKMASSHWVDERPSLQLPFPFLRSEIPDQLLQLTRALDRQLAGKHRIVLYPLNIIAEK